MTEQELLTKIAVLAGDQRNKSFPLAAKLAIAYGFTKFAETGCYRGTDGDGQSTVILGMLAAFQKGHLVSYELQQENIAMAQVKAGEYVNNITFVQGDSIVNLSRRLDTIQFCYLDSYDFGYDNPGPSQRHQLAEIGAILGKVSKPAIVLLDDCDLPHGGKGGLSVPFLEERGWKLIHKDYQRIYTNL